MATNFPGSMDSFANPTGADSLDDVAVLHSAQHANLNDAVEAIEGELGANPSGSEATVAARFTAVEGDVTTLEATVAALPGGSTDVIFADSSDFDGAANDGARITAACAAAYAAGVGVVQLADRVYDITGALLDTSGANAQILLPDVHMLDDAQFGLEIRGAAPQSACSSVVGAAVAPTTGTILKSTLTTGTGAVIGAYGSGTSYLHFTFVHLTLRNLTIRTVANPTITGLDLRHVNSCTLDGVLVDTGQYDTTLTEPTSSGSFGLRLPTLANGANVNLNRVSVFGFYNGIEHSEHASLDNVAVGATKVAITATAADHASHYRRILLGYYGIGLKVTGAHSIDIAQWDCEHAASGWYVTTADVSDASNLGLGNIRWHAVLQGVGSHNSFTKTGGTGFTTSRVGDAIGSGGGSATYVHRDRLTAAAGNTILTLGATPVANSPLVWVNGTIKWPTTDYTVSGAVITFGTGLSASDVVTVQYHSTTSTYTAATLGSGGVNILDNFTRADSSSLGTTSTGSKTWSGSTWGISSNQATLNAGAAGGASSNTCRVDAAVSDCTVSVKLSAVTAATNFYGPAVRLDSGAANGYLVQVNGPSSNIGFLKMTAGATPGLGSTVAYTPTAGDVISVVMSGTSLTLKVNGVTKTTVTDSTFQTNTRHGIWCYDTSGSIKFDDFSIQP